jgi:hypothetical protein
MGRDRRLVEPRHVDPLVVRGVGLRVASFIGVQPLVGRKKLIIAGISLEVCAAFRPLPRSAGL